MNREPCWLDNFETVKEADKKGPIAYRKQFKESLKDEKKAEK
jgi:hypothetical protein